jgi:hypothetical protein
MSDAQIVALIGIPIALIGYWVQASLARRADTLRFERDNKREVYNLFLTALVGMGLSKSGSTEHAKFSRELLESRARIILYGSRDVVAKLADFWVHPSLDSDEAYNNLTSVIQLMRLDVGASVTEGFDAHVKTILFERFSKAKTLGAR